MEKAIERVMQAYTMMVTIPLEEEAAARESLEQHLTGMTG